MKRVVLIIPCFNEAAVIGSSLVTLSNDLVQQDYVAWEVVCVDDGSTDGTSDIIRTVQPVCEKPNVHIQLVRLGDNQGKGAAIQAGLRACDADFYGYTDADLSISYQPVLRQIIDLLNTHGLVVGRRTKKRASGYTLFRTAASSIFSWTAYRIFKLPAHDIQCGFKFFSPPVKEIALAVSQPKFSFDLEFLSRARNAGESIHEIPVAWQHKQQSSVKIIDGLRYIADAVQVLLHK